MNYIVEKKLSANDLGITGSHQAGILIPKKSDLLEFFPLLDASQDNPRQTLLFLDDLDKTWKFTYIYYNNKLRGGTRNEYRLTGMTAFFRQYDVKAGDFLIFEKNGEDFFIRTSNAAEELNKEDGMISLVLGNKWKIIKY